MLAQNIVVPEGVGDQVMLRKVDDMISNGFHDMVPTKNEDIKKLDEVMVLQDDNTISINGVLSDDNIIAAEDMISVEKILGLTEDNIASDVMEEER
ncbi:hypothetical protein ACH3XW_37855 [Acanthocheilonema viteae]